MYYSFSDNFNLDGSQRPDYSNEAFGRFAAIDSIVAEGRFRMAAMVKVGVQKLRWNTETENFQPDKLRAKW